MGNDGNGGNDQLRVEIAKLRDALRHARLHAVRNGVGIREFSVICGVSAVQMSEWTSEMPSTGPDIVCRRPAKASAQKAAEAKQPSAQKRPGKIRLSGKGVQSEYAEASSADDAIEQANRIIEMTQDLPAPGWDFGESVAEKCRSFIETIENSRRVSPAQQQALDNMESGVQAWFRD